VRGAFSPNHPATQHQPPQQEKRLAPQLTQFTLAVVSALPMWEKDLAEDIDREFILNGIKQGFRLIDAPFNNI